MADFVWAYDGTILGETRVAGTDVPDELEALPSRTIARYLRQGLISVKQGGAGGGAAGIADYEPRAYTAGEFAYFEGSLWRAVADNAVEPYDANPAGVMEAGQIGTSGGTLNTSHTAARFTLSAAKTVSVIAVPWTAAGTYPSVRIGISSTTAFQSADSTPITDTAGNPAEITVTSLTTTAGGETVHTLPAPVELQAGVEYQLYMIHPNGGGGAWSISTTASLIGMTSQGMFYGNASYGNSNGSFHCRFRLLSKEPKLWELLEPYATWKMNGAYEAIVPADIQDSLIVGSEKMDRDPSAAGTDRRMFFNKLKGAFRSGTATSTQWDDAQVGTTSTALGANNTASGTSSFAAGDNCTASGNESVSLCSSSVASGIRSFASGRSTASNTYSHATGNSSATATYAHSEGLTTLASGQASHAEGESSVASGQASHAEGSSTTASGNNSHAGGSYAVAPRASQWSRGVTAYGTAGDSQFCAMGLMARTTGDTATAMTASVSSAVVLTGGGTNVLTIPASRAYMLKVSTAARRTNAQGEMAGFTWEGLVGRDSTGSARIIGTPTEAAWGDTPATDVWSLAVSINTTDATNNYVAVTATGEAGKTIRWVAKMEWTEVGG